MQRLESVQWQTGDYDIDLKTENIYQFIMYFNKNFHAFVRKYPGCHWYFKVKISIHQNIRNLQEFVSETFSKEKDKYNLWLNLLQKIMAISSHNYYNTYVIV
jgi:hypothetical protein